MFQRILIANDGSDGALRAFSVALDLAAALGSSLHMISVEEDLPRHVEEETIEEVQEQKDEEDSYYGRIARDAVSAAKKKGVPLEHSIVSGHEVQCIVEFARAERFNLLVIGYHGHSKLYDHLWGGTSQNLTRLSPCSVLVVR